MTIINIIDPTLEFGHSVPKAGSDIWMKLCKQDQLPGREAIDPVSLPRNLLPHIVLIGVEYEPYRRYRWRLIGTHVTAVIGRDSTGKYVDEVLGEDKYHEFIMPFEWVIEKKRPLRIWGNGTHAGKEWLKFESFLAPLSDDSGTINMLFSAARYGD